MKFGYVANPVMKDEDSKLETVALEVLDYSDLTKNAPKVVLQWVRGPRGDWAEGRFLGDIPLVGSAEVITIMRAFYNAIPDGAALDDPDAILVAMVRDGKMQQVAYDPRRKSYVAVSQIEDADMKTWQIACEVEGDHIVNAKDEAEAKIRAMQFLVKATQENPDAWADAMAGWFKSGQTVLQIANAKLPEVYSDTVYSKRREPRTAALKRAPKLEAAASE